MIQLADLPRDTGGRRPLLSARQLRDRRRRAEPDARDRGAERRPPESDECFFWRPPLRPRAPAPRDRPPPRRDRRRLVRRPRLRAVRVLPATAHAAVGQRPPRRTAAGGRQEGCDRRAASHRCPAVSSPKDDAASRGEDARAFAAAPDSDYFVEVAEHLAGVLRLARRSSAARRTRARSFRALQRPAGRRRPSD